MPNKCARQRLPRATASAGMRGTAGHVVNSIQTDDYTIVDRKLLHARHHPQDVLLIQTTIPWLACKSCTIYASVAVPPSRLYEEVTTLALPMSEVTDP